MDRRVKTANRSTSAVRARIGQRGTLVIPAALRRRLGFSEGTPVIAEERDGGLFVRSAAVTELSDAEREELLEGGARAYAALCADPQAWAEELAEREVWQRLAGETLPPETWTADDFVETDD